MGPLFWKAIVIWGHLKSDSNMGTLFWKAIAIAELLDVPWMGGKVIKGCNIQEWWFFESSRRAKVHYVRPTHLDKKRYASCRIETRRPYMYIKIWRFSSWSKYKHGDYVTIRYWSLEGAARLCTARLRFTTQ